MYSSSYIIFYPFIKTSFNTIKFRRGALIIRRLCVLLNAERVYRELSTILEGESDLDFASIMVQVCLTFP